MERGRIQGLPEFFEYPLLSQEPVKLLTLNFVRTFLVSIGTKVYQISGKVVGCVVRTLKTFQCTHILGASRGLLCDSSAVLFFLSSAADQRRVDVKTWIFPSHRSVSTARDLGQLFPRLLDQFCFVVDEHTLCIQTR